MSNTGNSKFWDFIDEKVNPAAFDMLDRVFPGLELRKVGSHWDTRVHFDGQRGNPNAVVSYPKYCNFFEQSSNTTRSYVNQIMTDEAMTDKYEAAKILADRVGLILPERGARDDEEYNRQEELNNEVLKYMSDLIMLPEAKPVRDYLATRGEWYKDAENLKKMGLGYKKHSFGGGEVPALVIPFASMGRVKGFKYRRIDAGTPKYLNDKGLDKGSSFFNLNAVGGDKDIVIVEGEIDALRASAMGLKNIVAAAGGDIHGEQIKKALSAGARTFTLLYDNDGKDSDNGVKIENALHQFDALGLLEKTYIAAFPDDEAGGKVDADTYLNTHTKEDFEALRKNAKRVYTYRAEASIKKHAVQIGSEEYDTKSDKDSDALLSELSELYFDCYPSDMTAIKGRLYNVFGAEVAERGISECRNRLSEERREQYVKSLIDKIKQTSAAPVGNLSDVLKKASEDLQEIDRESEFKELLKGGGRDTYIRAITEKNADLVTDYYYSSDTERIYDTHDTSQDDFRLTLPTGALTFVAAATSHGKSTMLENLMIQLADKYPSKRFFYMTFEEEESAILTNLLNIHIDRAISINNRKTIVSYFKNDEYYRNLNQTVKNYISDKEKGFFRKYIDTKRINVAYCDYKSEKLMAAIRYIAKNTDAGAVFIDYIQLVSTEKTSSFNMRQEELKDICLSLKDVAIETGLPIVLGCQFNRSVRCPDDMTLQNLSEAGDLERVANTVVSLWKCGTSIPNIAGKKQDLGNKSFFSEKDKLYSKILKRRGGQNEVSALFDWSGNKGRIYPNTKEVDTEEEKLQM